MLTPISPEARGVLVPLFRELPGLHGVVESVLEGVMGEAWADDPDEPRVGRIELDFNAIAGDVGSPSAAEALGSLASGDHVVAPESWTDLLLEVRGDGAQPYDRFAFSAPEEWDMARLLGFRESLADGLSLVRVDETNVGALAVLADSLVYNFDSHADFLARGVGFGVLEGTWFIAGCASYAISSRSLEFEIQTHPDYRRRGLALVTGSWMIEYCVENGLEACWDAAHEGSAVLAERLGFVGRRRYTAYRVE